LFPQPSLPLFLLSACMASPFVHLLCSIFIGKRTPLHFLTSINGTSWAKKNVTTFCSVGWRR
jgi:hypothetical protein